MHARLVQYIFEQKSVKLKKNLDFDLARGSLLFIVLCIICLWGCFEPY